MKLNAGLSEAVRSITIECFKQKNNDSKLLIYIDNCNLYLSNIFINLIGKSL